MGVLDPRGEENNFYPFSFKCTEQKLSTQTLQSTGFEIYFI